MDIVPIKTNARRSPGQLVSLEHRWQGPRDAVQEGSVRFLPRRRAMVFAPLLFGLALIGFELLPIFQHLRGSLGSDAAEHMRVPPNQLRVDAFDDLGNVKTPRLASQLGMKHDL